MSRNYRSTSLSKKPDNRHSLTPASSLSSVASSKSSDSSTDTTSRSCSSTNLSLFTSTDSQSIVVQPTAANKTTANLPLHKRQPTKNSMVVNPVIAHHPAHHHHHPNGHLISNRLTRSASTEQLNPLRFVAHNCLVKCMCLGQMSGEVFASVANDNQIKLWAIGNTQSLVSLKGRTAIECVQFSRNEEVLATGSLKGSVQIWDLNSKSLIRTFRGHTSTIKSLDFFPSGDFLTSGSADCTVKLWDSRKSDCVHTYDEHEKPICCQVFSPDGRWLASGDSESIKIWDLTACKKIADLKAHTGAITDIKFHPMVLIMASSSVDGTICFWELEQFKLIGRVSANAGSSSAASSGYNTSSSCSSNRSNSINAKLNEVPNSFNNAIHKIIFDPHGYQLFGTAKDKYILCDVSNEPELNSVVNLNFGIGRDLAFNKAGIIIGSHQQTYVSLQQVKWRDLDNLNNHFDRQTSANSTSSRRNFDQGQLHQTYLKLELLSSKYNDDLKYDPDDNDDLLKEVNFKDSSPTENGGTHVFSPKRELTRTPPKNEADFMAPENDKTYIIDSKTVEQFQKQLVNLKTKPPTDSIKLPVIQNCVRPQVQQPPTQNGHLTNSHLTNSNPQGSTMVPLNVSQPQTNHHHQSSNKLNQTQTNHVNRMRSVPKSLSLRNLNKVSAVVQPVQSKTNGRTDFNGGYSNNFGKITPAAVVYPLSDHSHHPHLHHSHHQHVSHHNHLNSTLSNGHHHHPLGHNSMSIANLSTNLSTNHLEPFKELNNLNSPAGDHHSNLGLLPSNVNLTLNSNNQGHSLSLSLGNLSKNAVLNLSTIDLNENQIVDDLVNGHREMEAILNQREISLKFALNTWKTDTNKGFTFAHSTQDMTIVAELVKLTINKSEWNIQLCQSILPQIDTLLRSNQEGCVDAALLALEFIIENFLDLIKQNIAKHPSIGVDLHREERCKKSMDCFTQLVGMRAYINKQQCLVGQLGTQFRRLSSLMERIDAK